ncbi:hypothetical protein Tco_0909033 [Tanacetum coccineum]|uniref:Uncharacterized protein n=1 Tax=Tanacetum coccineum TaxID=301880 RepID=A0ABQ5CQY9_9ASTR
MAKKKESSDEESDEQEEILIKRKPKAQLEIDTQEAIKDSIRESRFQHQSGGSSKGVGLTPEVLDEPTRKSAVSDEGASTSPEVPDETKDKSEALDDLDDWGSTDDETFLFNDKDEKAEDIPWVSTDEDESDDDKEEEDESIDIEKTDTDVEDQVMGVAEMNVAEKAEKEKADEEIKGDDQAADAQPKDDQFLTWKHLLLSCKEFLNWKKDVKELKQVDHSTTILESIKSYVPSAVDKYLGSSLGDTLQKIKQEHVVRENMPKYSTTPVDQADEDEHKQKDILFQMMMGSKPSCWIRPREEKRRTGKDAEPSKKSLKSKESAKGKTPSNTSKTGESVSADKSVHEPEHVVPMDVEDPNLDNVAYDADEPQADAIPKILKHDWFKQPPRPETLDPDWNTVKTMDDAPEQSWFNEMIQAEKPPLTFDELMSTPIDFSVFSMNRLKLNKITRADLVGLVFNLLKGTCKSYVELEYNVEECYRALTDQLD